jgi:hypothetical protein
MRTEDFGEEHVPMRLQVSTGTDLLFDPTLVDALVYICANLATH